MERITVLQERDEPVRWVFAGDSITHGAAHTDGWRDYTELFSERLRWEVGRPRDIVIKTGISGWTVEALANDLDANVLGFAPDVVSMMFGMNDCVQGPDGLNAFRERYRAVIATIQSRTGAAVLLHTPNAVIPPVNEERLTNLPAYRQAIVDLATELDLPVIDHFAVWSSPEFASAVHYWLPDGFHPNEFGHRVLARVLFQALDLWDDASPTCRLPIRPGDARS
jgi:lysophospholipase L1-like esterase